MRQQDVSPFGPTPDGARADFYSRTGDERDVTIIGAGCAGLFLARELYQRGFSCQILEPSPLSQFASTRNQGWLQSGAFYAGFGQAQVASECSQGFAYLREQFPDATDRASDGYFVFERDEDAKVFQTRCARLGIPARETNIAAIGAAQSVAAEVPFQHALVVDDCPFDAHMVLSKIARDLHDAGLPFHQLKSCANGLAISARSGRWHVELEGQEAAGTMLCSRAVALTAGAAIPALLGSVGRIEALHVQKIAILSVHRGLFRSLIAAPRATLGPNVVPFPDRAGFTCSLQKTDGRAQGPDDFDVTSRMLEDFCESLHHHYPLLGRHLSERTPAGVYVCQKLEPLATFRPSRGSVIIDHGTQSADLGGLFTFSPSKFTASPISAAACATAMAAFLGGAGAKSQYLSPTALAVARQQFLAQGRYHLYSMADGLHLDPSD